MTCNEFRTLLDRMEAGAPLPEDMLLHMESCPGCAMAHTLHLDCRTLDEDSEVPASFSSSFAAAPFMASTAPPTFTKGAVSSKRIFSRAPAREAASSKHSRCWAA